ncbi:structural cement protein Gp24 [Alkanindiges illinoisensis]|uniref:Bacteriophage protein n=1 Tax=Alkanindiges illinoisensis TaxID=197183 RepID=A0A4Y7XE94_9GAMM|nr:hypothetical protein [Alkanindiges illinoisensis]TEU30088.1 hypothetical protein E2B99_03345 [Alkanindiges illinoisensis]
MGNSILYRMPSGIPGDVTRRSHATTEAVMLGATPFASFGIFGKVVSGKLVPIGAGDTAADVYGLLVRAYPTQSSSNAQGAAVPPTSGVADVLRRGYMTVTNNAGTAALNGVVYVRVANAAAGKPIGGIEAVADSTNTIAITGARFMSEADAQGNVEIAFNI